MNARTHAVRVGLGRGWTEWLKSIRSAQDITFYVVVTGIALGYLFLLRGDTVGDSEVPAVVFSLPGVLAGLIVFGAYMGPVFTLATEKEDGTMLRAKALPHGMVGYVTGQAVFQFLGVLPMIVLLLAPALVFLDVTLSLAGAVAVAWVVLLGLLAVLPIGLAAGALVPSVRKAGTWGMLPVGALSAISGIFFPLQALWGWVQVVAQVFPMYWMGLGLRSAFLPESAAALELTGSWRTTETVLVLGAWAVVGLVLAPVVLRRMASKQSGSAVEAARHNAMQVVR